MSSAKVTVKKQNSWICGFENGATSGEAESKCSKEMGRHRRVEQVREQNTLFKWMLKSSPEGPCSRWRQRQSWKPKSSTSCRVMMGGRTQWSQAGRVAAQPMAFF